MAGSPQNIQTQQEQDHGWALEILEPPPLSEALRGIQSSSVISPFATVSSLRCQGRERYPEKNSLLSLENKRQEGKDGSVVRVLVALIMGPLLPHRRHSHPPVTLALGIYYPLLFSVGTCT